MEIIHDLISVQEYADMVYMKSYSLSSKSNTLTSMNAFEEFCRSRYKAGIRDLITSLRKQGLSPYRVLNDFIAYMHSKGNRATTIRSRVSYARQYLVLNEIEINDQRFRVLVKMPTVLREKRQPMTRKIVATILSIMPLEVKVFIMMMISTLRRPNELVQLRIRDIDFEQKRPVVTIPASISKNRTQNHTFLTLECKELLLTYLGKRISRIDEHIFPSDAKNTRNIVGKFQRLFRYHLVDLPELNGKKDSVPNRHKISLYNFKDFGFTRVQKVWDAEYARELKGDKTTEYSNLPLEEKMDMFVDCEPELTILNADAIKKELEVQYAEQGKELESLRKEVDIIKKALSSTRATPTEPGVIIQEQKMMAAMGRAAKQYKGSRKLLKVSYDPETDTAILDEN